MNNYSCLPPQLASELDEFVRHTIARARMHSRRLEQDASALTSEQTHPLFDASQLGSDIRAVVDDAISSTLHGRTGRNTYPLPEDLPPEIICGIWSCLDFRDLFAVTGVCRSWRTIGLETTLLWQHVEFVTTSHMDYCFCNRCCRSGKRYKSGGNNLYQVRMALARGGNCDVHLVMKMLIGDFEGNQVHEEDFSSERYVAGIHEHLERVRSLTWVTDRWVWLKSFISAALPRLQIFRVEAMGNAELSHRFYDSSISWNFDLDAPQLLHFHSSNGAVFWPAISPPNFSNITHCSTGISYGMSLLRYIIETCPRLAYLKLFVRHHSFQQGSLSENIAQTRTWQTLTIVGIHNQLEYNQLQQESDSFWDSLLSLRAHNFTLEYAPDEGPYVVPLHGLRIFSAPPRLGDFALQLICLASHEVTASRKDVFSAATEAANFDDIPGPVRTVKFHRDALSTVLGSASQPWVGGVWALYLQPGEFDFDDDAVSHIISTLSAVTMLSLSVFTAERGKQFLAKLRMPATNLPNLKVIHVITPKGTTTELVAATT